MKMDTTTPFALRSLTSSPIRHARLLPRQRPTRTHKHLPDVFHPRFHPPYPLRLSQMVLHRPLHLAVKEAEDASGRYRDARAPVCDPRVSSQASVVRMGADLQGVVVGLLRGISRNGRPSWEIRLGRRLFVG